MWVHLQSAALVLPGVLDVPSGHVLQKVTPSFWLYVPAGQTIQDDAAEPLRLWIDSTATRNKTRLSSLAVLLSSLRNVHFICWVTEWWYGVLCTFLLPYIFTDGWVAHSYFRQIINPFSARSFNRLMLGDGGCRVFLLVAASYFHHPLTLSCCHIVFVIFFSLCLFQL